jgi:hypothetical protein
MAAARAICPAPQQHRPRAIGGELPHLWQPVLRDGEGAPRRTPACQGVTGSPSSFGCSVVIVGSFCPDLTLRSDSADAGIIHSRRWRTMSSQLKSRASSRSWCEKSLSAKKREVRLRGSPAGWRPRLGLGHPRGAVLACCLARCVHSMSLSAATRRVEGNSVSAGSQPTSPLGHLAHFQPV